VALRAGARRHRLVGVFVFELIERKAAGLGDLHGAFHRRLMAAEQAGHLGCRLQMALGIGLEPKARLRNRAGVADAGDDVVQRLAVGVMEEHGIGGDERRRMAHRQSCQAVEPGPVAAAIEHVGDEMEGCAVQRPADVGEGRLEGLARPGLGRHDGQDQPFAMVRRHRPA
jgi:hypothetical protein